MPYKRFEVPRIAMAANIRVGTDKPAKQYLVRRSKKLPKWLWCAIACSLGIKIETGDRGIVATILYSLTVLSALVFVLSTLTFVVSAGIQAHSLAYGSASTNLSSRPTTLVECDMTDGCVMVTLTLFWCLLGLYAQALAYRLYSSTKFLEMVRLHAKTILKVNAAFVFFLLVTTFVSLNNVQAYYIWYARHSTCSSVGASRILCQVRFISQSVFSVFAILWNSLVGIVLLSVCRTNTMGIRRFIQDLEKDAQIYEKQLFGPGASTSEMIWLADNDADQSSESEAEAKTIAHRKRFSSVSTVTVFASSHEVDQPTGEGCVAKALTPRQPAEDSAERSSERNTLELLAVSPGTLFGTSGSSARLQPDAKETKTEPLQPMSTAVILNRYWKLSCATRLSSLTFQRWTTCVTALCLTWVSIGLVQWLSTTPQSLQVIQVAVPMLILPLLSAAYAEVNVEGKRLLKCICPMEDRLAALYVMWQSPPAMTIFGVVITYATLGTAAAGILLALASRAVLKQLGAASN